MFCSQCGNKLADGARFCSNCGSPVSQPVSQASRLVSLEKQSVPAASSGGLPVGMTRLSDGKIRWNFADGKANYVAMLDETELVLFLEAKPKKKRSVFGGLGMLVLDIVALHDDDYLIVNGDLPSELFSEAPRVTMDGKDYHRVSLDLSRITNVEDDRAHGRLKVRCSGNWHSLSVTEQQYGFLIDYLAAHCRNLKLE